MPSTTQSSRSSTLLLALLLLPLACRSAAPEASAVSDGRTLRYPAAPRSDVVDVYHGTPVADPFRPLEDPDDPQTRAWIEEENQLTQAWLDDVPGREELEQRLTELWQYERFGVPHKEGDSYYFSYTDGRMQQPQLCRLSSLEAERELVLDPNTFSEDGTVSLGGASYSEDGRYLAYGLSDGGSDWRSWHVLDLQTLEPLEDHLQWIKFSSPAWTHDGLGFFYGRYPATSEMGDSNQDQRIYYHRLGTAQEADELVWEDPENPRRISWPMVSDEGRYLLLSLSEGSADSNRLYLREINKEGATFVRLFDENDARYLPITNEGRLFWIQTTKDAPSGRVVKVDASLAGGPLIEIIPERAETLRSVSRVGDRLLALYLKDARSLVRVYDLEGQELSQVELPGIGTAGGFGGDRHDSESFYAFSSYTRPTSIWRYELESGESTLFRSPDLPFDSGPYETRQVFVTSRDGTRVPMFVTCRRDLELDGQNPTLLYGYGGFNISLTPSFSPATAAWLEMGGVYAVPNLRGGGEYGRTWHAAGTKQNKQNVFDDFIAAAEWLIEEGYTNSSRLAIFGGSNGGLLVGACLNQRPDLFAAAMPAVGVMDMLRYHQFTIGWAWASDYGTSDDPEMFPHLRAYSPLHNIRPGTAYPATFVTTADHDDRVVPGHSFKYAAALQSAQAGEDPILIRIETRAGHGAGKSVSQQIEETADRYAFLRKALGMF